MFRTFGEVELPYTADHIAVKIFAQVCYVILAVIAPLCVSSRLWFEE